MKKIYKFNSFPIYRIKMDKNFKIKVNILNINKYLQKIIFLM